ncbi:MAG: XrtA-associated tyrosine autokinase [Saprospiraceae bacterium]|nr:XrtA-associated tyrosine autokinase [Saprospiraceae bacterium]
MSRIEEALRKVSNRGAVNGQKDRLPEPQGELPRRGNLHVPQKKDMHKLLEVDEPIQLNNLLLLAGSDKEAKGAITEEFNKLKSSIIALTRGEKFLNTLMVTSTVSEEGKTITALNLAMAMAREHDHTVLLVDADLRRPSVCRYLGIESQYGLAHCLEEDVPIEKALIKTGIGKLVVLPAGKAIEDPVDLLSSSRMTEIIYELKGRYPDRYIIFDTPPAMPFADAKVLAAVLDGLLFVVRDGKVARDALQKTLDEIEKYNLLGIVYNDVKSIVPKKDYYY